MTQTFWRRQVITQATNRIGTGRPTSANVAPDPEQIHQKVSGEFNGQHLRNDVQVGNEGRLQNDGDVGRVEQFDGVGGVLATVASRFDGQIDAESLEVYDDSKDEDCGQQIHQVGQVLAVESLAESSNLVLTSSQKVEQGNNGTFELCASASVDCRRTESLPHDRLANVGGDKERNTRAETIALLEQFVEQQDDQTGDKKLDDDQKANTTTDFTRFAVHARHNVDDRLANSNHHTEHCK